MPGTDMKFTACVKTLESGKTEGAAHVALHGPEIVCSKSRLFLFSLECR